MKLFFTGVSFYLCILIFINLYRAIYGPDILTRIAAINATGTKTVMILILIGFIYGRVDMFIDIAIVYALLSFISTIVATKYFLTRRSID
ncbi:MAG: pH regulation protein F [Deltaproteobacteria bacterium]|nr:MAG: pH regulation protein F [Deltaproteobacteria bacterium]